jgi:hypothetical protein
MPGLFEPVVADDAIPEVASVDLKSGAQKTGQGAPAKPVRCSE